MASTEAEKSCSAHLQATASHTQLVCLVTRTRGGRRSIFSLAGLPLCSLQPETVFDGATSCSQQAEAAVLSLWLMKIELLFNIKWLYLMIGALEKDCLLYDDLQRTMHLPHIWFFLKSSSVRSNSLQLSWADTISARTGGAAARGSEQ